MCERIFKEGDIVIYIGPNEDFYGERFFYRWPSAKRGFHFIANEKNPLNKGITEENNIYPVIEE